MELRWREGNDKGGAWVLQQQVDVGTHFEWVDVPQVADPPKSRRQEKVEELAKVLFETPVSRSSTSRPHELAEAALEWVEKQMPKNRLSERRVIGDTIESYNQALSDVRRNLGLDQ